jgi:hypothetical protein
LASRSAAATTGVLLYDLHVACACILPHDLELVLWRILLMLDRHAAVLSRTRPPARSRMLKQVPCWVTKFQAPACVKAILKNSLYYVVGIWGVSRDKVTKSIQTFRENPLAGQELVARLDLWEYSYLSITARPNTT